LEALIDSRFEDLYAHFMVCPAEDSFPALIVYVRDGVCALYYMPTETGMWCTVARPRLEGEDVEFRDGPQQVMWLAGSVVVPWTDGRQCVLEFCQDFQKPKSASWLELCE